MISRTISQFTFLMLHYLINLFPQGIDNPTNSNASGTETSKIGKYRDGIS